MKSHYFKYTCLTAGLLAAVTLSPSLRAEESAPRPASPALKEGKGNRAEMTLEQREEMAQKRLERLSEKLGLDDSQKRKAEAIMEGQKEKMKALRNDESIAKEDKVKRLKEIMKEGREAITAILTPEQKAKFAEMKNRGPGAGQHDPSKDDLKKGSENSVRTVPTPAT